MTEEAGLTMRDILEHTPVIPVLTLTRAEDAVPLAHALASGGLNVIEITLRTAQALEAIRSIAVEVPGAIVGAGTITSTADMKRAEEAGAHFAVSPGATPALLEGAGRSGIPLLPGVATASELMQVRAAGFRYAKFFPAEAAGGVATLAAFAGPFPDMHFCPTGGIGPDNFRKYIELPNVVCVGGSWIAPAGAVRTGDWARVTALARTAAGNGPPPTERTRK